MLVPAMQSTGTRISSSTSRTPRWAPPRAPPPPSTRPMRGRAAAASAQAANAATARISAAALRLQREGREARVPIIVVLVLDALEPADDRVRHRHEHDFDRNLADELRDHGDRDLVVRKDTRPVHRQRIEDERVDALAQDGRADDPGPEPPALREDL